MTPDQFKNKLFKNPWFLWLLNILGVNPLEMVTPEVQTSALHMNELAASVHGNAQE
jgi:hypothetical protein